MQFMQQPLHYRLLALLFAAFVVAGCASTSTEPAEEPEEIEQPAPVSPPPTETVERGDFADGGDGLVPIDGSGRPISLTYYFEYDKAVIAQEDLRSLQLHAAILRRNPDRSVVIEGHCDERGTREYNLALGERRANAVRSFLSSAGVSSRQIETVSYGEEQPEDPGHTETAWSKNRRGVLVYR
jgi:peptidoglycan-associated lipoprotein